MLHRQGAAQRSCLLLIALNFDLMKSLFLIMIGFLTIPDAVNTIVWWYESPHQTR